jgi:hypothetical protein
MTSPEDSAPLTTIREASREEKRLLKEEYEAEIALIEAREELTQAIARLQKEEERVARRREQVGAAVDALKRAQDARATGPKVADHPAATEPAAIETIPPKDDSIASTARKPATRRKAAAAPPSEEMNP